jgi:small subunit ribosomal protein S2
MKRFIFGSRNGIHIHDLSKTMSQIREAVKVIREVVAKRKKILIVGTKKQAKEVVKECAEASGQFYACERWLGGTLTNLTTIRNSVNKMQKNQEMLEQKELMLKKEAVRLEKEFVKLNRNLCGIQDMKKLPGLLIVIDPNREHIAVAEAITLGIPVMALVDTNCDPDPIDYIIACNDDSHKSIKTVMNAIMQPAIEKFNETKISMSKEDEMENFEPKEGEE